MILIYPLNYVSITLEQMLNIDQFNNLSSHKISLNMVYAFMKGQLTQ